MLIMHNSLCRRTEEPFNEYPGSEACVYFLGVLLFAATSVNFIKHCVVVAPINFILKSSRKAASTKTKQLNFSELTLHQALHGVGVPEPSVSGKAHLTACDRVAATGKSSPCPA